jgi:putative spermidine/putrescine transport system permease protein
MAWSVESRGTRYAVVFGTVIGLAFLYVPLVVVVIYAFNDSVAQAWPPKGFTTSWFELALGDSVMWSSLLNTVKVAAVATAIALLLGGAASFALHRFAFFGRQAVSFLLVLPIALPGILTGMALRTGINTFEIPFSLWTIMIGHSTFCIVVVFNNVIARLRRTPTSLVEASMDLGAGGWQTFRHVTLPAIGTALVAGGLLAFALSFDEIIVTNFTSGSELTLPKWIFNAIRLPRNRPEANAVAAIVMLLSLVPVYLAQRLSGGSEDVAGSRRPVRAVPAADDASRASVAAE